MPTTHSKQTISTLDVGSLALIKKNLIGLKKLCETKDGPDIVLMKHHECKNQLTKDDMVVFLHDSFQDFTKFMWHAPTKTFIRTYKANVPTRDHIVIHYSIDNDEHNVCILQIPYDQPEIVKDMAKQSAKILFVD